MKFISEKQLPNGDWLWDVDFEEGEIEMLVNYAVNDILKKYLEENEKEEKVYCKDCVHLTNYLDGWLCKSPKNIGDTWYNKMGGYIDPEEKNNNNDCEWFKGGEI